jgi:hypothetical protein
MRVPAVLCCGVRGVGGCMKPTTHPISFFWSRRLHAASGWLWPSLISLPTLLHVNRDSTHDLVCVLLLAIVAGDSAILLCIYVCVWLMLRVELLLGVMRNFYSLASLVCVGVCR